MTDEQLKRKADIKKILMGSGLLLLLAIGLFYFRWKTNEDITIYKSQKAQEATVQSQVNALTSSNAELMAVIEENGQELVSFTEDKIKYVNLASQLSLAHQVHINQLTVSDVWQEGEMSGMTTTIEVEGDLTNIKEFIEEYCSTNYTNRINVVSCRPTGRYAWVSRNIDENNVISWFNLGPDEAMYIEQQQQEQAEAYQQQSQADFGLPITFIEDTELSYSYDQNTGKFYYNGTSVEVPQSVLDETPITLEKMFANNTIKAYLVIDFLGRA